MCRYYHPRAGCLMCIDANNYVALDLRKVSEVDCQKLEAGLRSVSNQQLGQTLWFREGGLVCRRGARGAGLTNGSASELGLFMVKYGKGLQCPIFPLDFMKGFCIQVSVIPLSFGYMGL